MSLENKTLKEINAFIALYGQTKDLNSLLIAVNLVEFLSDDNKILKDFKKKTEKHANKIYKRLKKEIENE